jgi:hypothetical protein
MSRRSQPILRAGARHERRRHPLSVVASPRELLRIDKDMAKWMNDGARRNRSEKVAPLTVSRPRSHTSLVHCTWRHAASSLTRPITSYVVMPGSFLSLQNLCCH